MQGSDPAGAPQDLRITANEVCYLRLVPGRATGRCVCGSLGIKISFIVRLPFGKIECLKCTKYLDSWVGLNLTVQQIDSENGQRPFHR